MDLGGVTAEVTEGAFTAATAGTAASPSGINGSYTFTVVLSKGGGDPQTTRLLTLNIEALPYEDTSTEEEGEVPKTGDIEPILIWLLLCIISAAGLVTIGSLKRVRE